MKVSLVLAPTAQSSFEFVSLSSDVYSSLYPGIVDIKNKIVSLTFTGSNVLTRSQLFPITIDDSLPFNQIKLESLKFLQKFGSNFTVDTVNITKIDKIPRLNEIIVSYPNEIYSILQFKSSESIHKLISNERESNIDYTIIRTGDISHSLNGEIIHTIPFEQGYIDSNTTITIVEKNSIETSHPIEELVDFDPTVSKPISIECKVSVQDSKTLNFTQYSKFLNDFPFDDVSIYACLHYHEFRKLNCLSGDIVKLTVDQTHIFVKILPFIEPCAFAPSIYLSPILLNTLSNPSKVTITTLQETHNNKLSRVIPLCKDISISRISTPLSENNKLQYSYLSNLKSYFESSHRIISKGQLIPISIDLKLAESLHQTYSLKGWFPDILPSGNPDKIVWFMVNDGMFKDPVTGELRPLEIGHQYFINSQKSRMIQSGVTKFNFENVNIRDITQYLNINPNFNFIDLPGKPSFTYARTLRKIFQTSIKTKGKINLKTTVLIHSNTRYVGKSTLVRSISEEFGYALVEVDSFELLNSSMGSPATTIGMIRGKIDRLIESCDSLVVFIKHLEAICKKGDEQQMDQKNIDDLLSLNLNQLISEYTSKGVIFIGTCADPDDINDNIRSLIKFEINVNVPNDIERREILRYLLEDLEVSNDVNIESLALQSAALTPNDLEYIVSNVKLIAKNRLKKESKDLNIKFNELIKINGGSIILNSEDFENSINKARNKFSDSIGAPRIPNVKWEDVGGLDLVKNEILDTIEMPLKHPELFGSGMKKRSGLLFYGPPGTGKTLLAKAIATNFSLNFFSVKGPELLNMYIGESEANVRRVFERARDAKPCVIFFDELDSVAPRRGNQGDSGGVMDRIVSQLLAELDGMSGGDGGDGVFVVGASNRPDLLDEALLRPGRFDKMLYLGISDTHEKQAKIIGALTRKFTLHKDIDLFKIAETCPFNFTGADFYALCSDAMLNAMIRTAGNVDQKLEQYNLDKKDDNKLNLRQWFDKVATDADLNVVLSKEDFLKARQDLVASVSEDELKHYLQVRENFEGSKA